MKGSETKAFAGSTGKHSSDLAVFIPVLHRSGPSDGKLLEKPSGKPISSVPGSFKLKLAAVGSWLQAPGRRNSKPPKRCSSSKGILTDTVLERIENAKRSGLFSSLCSNYSTMSTRNASRLQSTTASCLCLPRPAYKDDWGWSPPSEPHQVDIGWQTFHCQRLLRLNQTRIQSQKEC